MALSAQDPESTSLVAWTKICMTVTLLAQFDGMMQLAHLIFQRPVMQ
jgi:hypothetical protein